MTKTILPTMWGQDFVIDDDFEESYFEGEGEPEVDIDDDDEDGDEEDTEVE